MTTEDVPPSSPSEPLTVRQRWARIAEGFDGLAAPSELFRDVIGPERLEGRGLSDAMLHMWCCFLTWLGLARSMGIGSETGDPECDHAYVIGHAGSDAVSVCTRHGAWRQTWAGVPADAPFPGLGDMVVIGPGGYHCRACIVDVEPQTDPHELWVSIVEGGHQDTHGNMCIGRVRVRIWMEHGAMFCGAHEASPASRVYGWADCTKLPDPGATLAGDRTEASAGPEAAPDGHAARGEAPNAGDIVLEGPDRIA